MPRHDDEAALRKPYKHETPRPACRLQGIDMREFRAVESRYAGVMTGSRMLRIASFLIVLGFVPSADARDVSVDVVTLTPKEVIAGSPELIRVRAKANNVSGEWLGRKLGFFPGADRMT